MSRSGTTVLYSYWSSNDADTRAWCKKGGSVCCFLQMIRRFFLFQMFLMQIGWSSKTIFLQWIFTKSTIRWACSWQKKMFHYDNFFLKMVLMQIGQFYNTFHTLLQVIQIIQIWAGVSQRGLFKKTIVFNDLESNIESIWSATTIFRDRKCWMTVAERFRKGKRSGPNIIVVIMNIRQCHFIQQLRSASFQYRTYPFSTELAKVVYSFSRPENKRN